MSNFKQHNNVSLSAKIKGKNGQTSLNLAKIWQPLHFKVILGCGVPDKSWNGTKLLQHDRYTCYMSEDIKTTISYILCKTLSIFSSGIFQQTQKSSISFKRWKTVCYFVLFFNSSANFASHADYSDIKHMLSTLLSLFIRRLITFLFVTDCR